jgi:hypothetical protein
MLYLNRPIIWLFKGIIRFILRHPTFSTFLKRIISTFPKLENNVYAFYQQHILKASHCRKLPKNKYAIYSENTEKTYQQLTNLRQPDENSH